MNLTPSSHSSIPRQGLMMVCHCAFWRGSRCRLKWKHYPLIKGSVHVCALQSIAVLPHTQELRLLSRSRCFGFHLQTVDVSDRDDGGGHVPRQPHEGANHQENGHPEQIQMVTCPFLVQTTRWKVMSVRAQADIGKPKTQQAALTWSNHVMIIHTKFPEMIGQLSHTAEIKEIIAQRQQWLSEHLR